MDEWIEGVCMVLWREREGKRDGIGSWYYRTGLDVDT